MDTELVASGLSVIIPDVSTSARDLPSALWPPARPPFLRPPQIIHIYCVYFYNYVYIHVSSLSVYRAICQSAELFLCLSGFLIFICLSVYPSIYTSVLLFLFTYLPILFLCLVFFLVYFLFFTLRFLPSACPLLTFIASA